MLVMNLGPRAELGSLSNVPDLGGEETVDKRHDALGLCERRWLLVRVEQLEKAKGLAGLAAALKGVGPGVEGGSIAGEKVCGPVGEEGVREVRKTLCRVSSVPLSRGSCEGAQAVVPVELGPSRECRGAEDSRTRSAPWRSQPPPPAGLGLSPCPRRWRTSVSSGHPV